MKKPSTKWLLFISFLVIVALVALSPLIEGLYPYKGNPCAAFKTCKTCADQGGCGWCEDKGECKPMSLDGFPFREDTTVAICDEGLDRAGCEEKYDTLKKTMFPAVPQCNPFTFRTYPAQCKSDT